MQAKHKHKYKYDNNNMPLLLLLLMHNIATASRGKHCIQEHNITQHQPRQTDTALRTLVHSLWAINNHKSISISINININMEHENPRLQFSKTWFRIITTPYPWGRLCILGFLWWL